MTETNDSANSSRPRPYPYEDMTINIEDLQPKDECCIYRVPRDLRLINEKAYTPQVISIGPLHHGKKELIDMEKQKKRYIHIFIGERNGKRKLNDMKSYIKREEQRIRNCYEDFCDCGCPEKSCKCLKVSFLENEFINMVLHDAVFIIELFWRHYWQINDFLLEKPRYRNTIKRDLQLLENQLPYFVLEHLYISAFNHCGIHNHEGSVSPSFFQISCNFFSCDVNMMRRPSSSIVVKHFTDLIRHFVIKGHPETKEAKKVEDLPCATKLHESGVRFKCVRDRCMLELKFESSKRGILPFFKKYELEIPNFKVNDWTEVQIRNLMALEQCHYPKETYVCNYISLMDFLINTEKDADLLIGKEIITNCLGEDAAIAKMFNGFCLQTSSPFSCYYDMATDLKTHYRSPYHHAKGTLKSVYFSNPWKGTGTVVATILLVLTFVQAAYSILKILKA